MQPSQDLYKQLVDYDSTRKNSVDVLNDALGKYGVPEIRNRVSGLRTTLSNTESALNAVDPSVTGRTQGSLVTEAQRTKQVANERAPIAEQYGQYSRGLGNAQADLTDRERAAQMLAESQQSDWQAGRSAIADRYNLASAAEQEQRRRLEADRAFELDRSKAAKGNGFNGFPAEQAPKATDPVQQSAHDEVIDRVRNSDFNALLSDYLATAKSAGFGNLKDKYKVQVYQQYRPDVVSAGDSRTSAAASLLNMGGLKQVQSNGLNALNGNLQGIRF